MWNFRNWVSCFKSKSTLRRKKRNGCKWMDSNCSGKKNQRNTDLVWLKNDRNLYISNSLWIQFYLEKHYAKRDWCYQKEVHPSSIRFTETISNKKSIWWRRIIAWNLKIKERNSFYKCLNVQLEKIGLCLEGWNCKYFR